MPQAKSRRQRLSRFVSSGAVRISINQRHQLADTAHTHRDLEARRTVGSAILLT
jgi:NADPH:quinone reductase